MNLIKNIFSGIIGGISLFALAIFGLASIGILALVAIPGVIFCALNRKRIEAELSEMWHNADAEQDSSARSRMSAAG